MLKLFDEKLWKTCYCRYWLWLWIMSNKTFVQLLFYELLVNLQLYQASVSHVYSIKTWFLIIEIDDLFRSCITNSVSISVHILWTIGFQILQKSCILNEIFSLSIENKLMWVWKCCKYEYHKRKEMYIIKWEL